MFFQVLQLLGVQRGRGPMSKPLEGKEVKIVYDHNDYAKEFGKYIWCLHCEKVFNKEDWLKNKFHCPDNNCDGSPIDAWDWNDLLKNNPVHPKIPEPGKYYPLYSD